MLPGHLVSRAQMAGIKTVPICPCRGLCLPIDAIPVDVARAVDSMVTYSARFGLAGTLALPVAIGSDTWQRRSIVREIMSDVFDEGIPTLSYARRNVSSLYCPYEFVVDLHRLFIGATIFAFICVVVEELHARDSCCGSGLAIAGSLLVMASIVAALLSILRMLLFRKGHRRVSKTFRPAQSGPGGAGGAGFRGGR